MPSNAVTPTSISVPVEGGSLEADLTLPPSPTGLVIFAHGSGSSRHSPRNQLVARELQGRRLATLLADLLTPSEEETDRYSARWRFDIALLGRRVETLIDWAGTEPHLSSLPLGLFGASTGAAAALVAAARRPDAVSVVVSRGGRPDLAGDALPQVRAATLLLVGERDEPVISMNQDAMARMQCPVQLEIVPGATHLFEEPGTLEQAARLAAEWFNDHLAR